MYQFVLHAEHFYTAQKAELKSILNLFPDDISPNIRRYFSYKEGMRLNFNIVQAICLHICR